MFAGIINLAAAAINFAVWQWSGHDDINLFCFGLSLGLGLALTFDAVLEARS